MNWWKYKKILLSMLVLIGGVLFCIIQIIIPNKVYTYEGEFVFEQGVPIEKQVLYEAIALPPGVYEIQLDYVCDTNIKNICSVVDGTVFSGGLLTIGEHTYVNKECTDFNIWLLEATEQMQIIMDYTEGFLQTGNLKIMETDLLWTMCMTICIFCIFLLFAVKKYLECDAAGLIDREQKNAFFGVAFIVLIASLPYLQPGMNGGADLGYHLHRIEGIRNSIVIGQFPIRIEPQWLYEYGYANAIFYCPLFLYIPGILRVLGFTVSGSYAIYCWFINILTACISYYSFSCIFKNRRIGVMCCGLYTLSIFRIYKMFVTGAVGEAGAVSFMPLIIYGFFRLLTEDVKDKKYKTVWLPLGLGYAGIIQTHVLSCEIAAMLSVLVCIIFLKKIIRKETFVELVKGAVTAGGLTLWYLVPFLDYFINEDVHIHYVSARTIQDRGLYIAQLLHNFWRAGSNALLGESGMYHSHPVGLGFVLVLGVGLFVVICFTHNWKADKKDIYAFGKLMSIFSLLMMWMSLSVFPWDRIQKMNDVMASLVSSIQFPNRFLGWGTTFAVSVFGCCLWLFWKNKNVYAYYAMIIWGVIGLTTSSIYLTEDVCKNIQFMKLYNEDGMGYGYISGAEYIPQGVDYNSLFYDVPVTGEGVELYAYEKEFQMVEMNCENITDNESYVEVPIMLYKGYIAVDKERNRQLDIVQGENGVVRVILPPNYSGNIFVRFKSPIYWRISEVISAICMAVVVWNVFRKRRSVRKVQCG